MAKGSQFWGNASGKLGEQVLYRAGGEQRARAYTKNVKNPKTKAQMENRILMNNVISAFRSMKPVVAVSFPNRPANQSGFNAFVKANKNVAAYAIDKETMEQGGCIPFGLFASKGDIPISIGFETKEVSNYVNSEEDPKYILSVTGLFTDKSVLTVSSFTEDYVEVTPKQLYDLLVSNGNPLGLPSEFKVTIVGSLYGTGGEGNSDTEAYYLGWRQYLCTSAGEGSIVTGGNSESVENLQFRASVVGSVQGDETFTKYHIDGLSVCAPRLTENMLADICAAVIISWTENGKTRVTTSKFGGANSVPELVALWQKGGSVYEQVLNQYGYTAESLLATK